MSSSVDRKALDTHQVDSTLFLKDAERGGFHNDMWDDDFDDGLADFVLADDDDETVMQDRGFWANAHQTAQAGGVPAYAAGDGAASVVQEPRSAVELESHNSPPSPSQIPRTLFQSPQDSIPGSDGYSATPNTQELDRGIPNLGRNEEDFMHSPLGLPPDLDSFQPTMGGVPQIQYDGAMNMAPAAPLPHQGQMAQFYGSPPGFAPGVPSYANTGRASWEWCHDAGAYWGAGGFDGRASLLDQSFDAYTQDDIGSVQTPSMTFENSHMNNWRSASMHMDNMGMASSMKHGRGFGKNQNLRSEPGASEASVADGDESVQRDKKKNALADKKEQDNKERFRAQFFKTRLCRFYREGCRRSESCPFAHGHDELSQRPDLAKTSICKQWELGCCPLAADECEYAHGNDDLRVTNVFNKSAMCTRYPRGLCHLGDRCRHAHSVNELQKPMGRSKGKASDP